MTLAFELAPSEGCPFGLRLEAAYTVDGGGSPREGGLAWTVRATNTGDAASPYGVCPHPYLVAGASPLDALELEIPAERFLEVTPDRLPPVEQRRVEGHDFDFWTPRAIGATEIDHAFTGIGFDADGEAGVALRDREHGTGVAMVWDRSCPWLQIHTGDKQPPAPNRLGLAVEPMTCSPDAFNSGSDLVTLPPERSTPPDGASVP
ncbi:hypothetical protein SPF06_18755 [Sinomonas sp. JGH33]|uniref:Galactose mutarotase n=1 Tax=Sinomonas terricola TaxID=3110330 RepID=A0ABU5TAQ8_9MICC|nr:hypothetical protein [Sinomonas sp. JGH33]MEA5456769.1 hypothetical protein [Sinomonas sp. JGH33]